MDYDRLKGALAREDLDNELSLKRAEERIAAAKGEEYSAGLRWMLRRLRRRLFASPDGRPPAGTSRRPP